MKKIEQFQITSMSISGFKSYEGPTDLIFGQSGTIAVIKFIAAGIHEI